MQIEFEGNYLLTRFTIVAKRGQEFRALIDTASLVTGIPENDCISLGLKAEGTAQLGYCQRRGYLSCVWNHHIYRWQKI